MGPRPARFAWGRLRALGSTKCNSIGTGTPRRRWGPDTAYLLKSRLGSAMPARSPARSPHSNEPSRFRARTSKAMHRKNSELGQSQLLSLGVSIQDRLRTHASGSVVVIPDARRQPPPLSANSVCRTPEKRVRVPVGWRDGSPQPRLRPESRRWTTGTTRRASTGSRLWAELAQAIRRNANPYRIAAKGSRALIGPA
jgi:hypothetical protein